MGEKEPYQKFTAIGQIIDQQPYQVDMGSGFMPYRRNVRYCLEAQHADIYPLIPLLPCIANKTAWGATFRYGFLEIDRASFLIIAQAMLAKNPLGG